MSSNYPPGVTGSEPEEVQYDGCGREIPESEATFDELPFRDGSDTGTWTSCRSCREGEDFGYAAGWIAELSAPDPDEGLSDELADDPERNS